MNTLPVQNASEELLVLRGANPGTIAKAQAALEAAILACCAKEHREVHTLLESVANPIFWANEGLNFPAWLGGESLQEQARALLDKLDTKGGT